AAARTCWSASGKCARAWPRTGTFTRGAASGSWGRPGWRMSRSWTRRTGSVMSRGSWSWQQGINDEYCSPSHHFSEMLMDRLLIVGLDEPEYLDLRKRIDRRV